jgi:hypothetical protein
MSIFSTNVKATGRIYILAPNLAAASQKMRKLKSTVFHVSDVNYYSSVHHGDPHAAEISIANHIWGEAPTLGDPFKRVSESAMIDGMYLSDNSPPETFQFSAPDHVATGKSLYWTPIDLRCLAFIKARSYAAAREIAARITGSIQIDEDRASFEDWFMCAGIDNREMPFVLSPVMEVIGVSNGHELKQLWPKLVDDEKNKNVTPDLRVAGARLKASLSVLGGNFALMSAEDAVDIARYAKVLLDRRVS